MFKYVSLAIPIFILFIAIEAGVSWWHSDKNYRFTDAITNISLGLGQTVIDALLKTVLIILYIAVYERLAIFQLPDNWTVFLIIVIIYDFIYYWFHRFSHRINFLWAVHIVHHSSEDFNFTVALRQAWLHKTVAFAFFAPFPLLGVSPIMFALVNAFQTLYQFWLHTKYIGKLGPVEWLFVTPSHHRVHHSFSQQYLDKNFGGTFIIWDRLFGSFAEEKEAPVYGITKPLKSWNPLWANIHYWKDLFIMAYQTKDWRDKFRTFFQPPSWKPDDLKKQKEYIIDVKNFQKYDTPVSPALAWYILIQFVVIMGMALHLLLGWTPFETSEKLLFTGMILWALTQFGLLLHHRSWAFPIEFGRLALLYLMLLFFFDTYIIQIVGGVAIILFGIWIYFAWVIPEKEAILIGVKKKNGDNPKSSPDF